MPDETLSPNSRRGLALWIAVTALYYYLNFSLAFYHENEPQIQTLLDRLF